MKSPTFARRIVVLVVLQVIAVVNAFTTAPVAPVSSRWSSTTSSSSSSSPSQQYYSQPLLRRSISSSTSSSRLSTATAVNGETTSEAATTSSTSSSSSSTAADSSSNTLDNVRLNVFEKARTVTSVCTSGTLCTMSAHEGIEGAPFGSFVDYVLDDQGNPVLLMNEMSMHTINIQKATEQDGTTPLVTLFTQLSGGQQQGPSLGSGPNSGAAGGAGSGGNSKSSQDVARCSLTGTLERIQDDADDMDAIRMRYSLTHVYADQVMDSPKFAFYRLTPHKIYFVGGFGVLAKWVEPDEYKTANPDILAKEASDILTRINRDHADDLRLTAEQLLDVPAGQLTKIRVTNVDRLGMDCRVTSQMGSRRNKLQTDEFRIGFRIPVISVEDAKSEILKVFQEAWEKANGYSWSGDDDEPGSNVPIFKIAADSLE